MKKLFLAAILAVVSMVFAAETFADTYVRGYTRKDGTYVAPHYRSSPNQSYNDNWSVKPNVNPYTGQRGTRAPTFENRAPASNTLGGQSRSPYRQHRY